MSPLSHWKSPLMKDFILPAGGLKGAAIHG
jgi:hypothetical protein